MEAHPTPAHRPDIPFGCIECNNASHHIAFASFLQRKASTFIRHWRQARSTTNAIMDVEHCLAVRQMIQAVQTARTKATVQGFLYNPCRGQPRSCNGSVEVRLQQEPPVRLRHASRQTPQRTTKQLAIPALDLHATFEISLPTVHFSSSLPPVQDTERSYRSTSPSSAQNVRVRRTHGVHEEIEGNLPADGKVGTKRGVPATCSTWTRYRGEYLPWSRGWTTRWRRWTTSNPVQRANGPRTVPTWSM